ncbi:MAG: PAS domain-containing sensor histidine kinase [Clostridiales bacterium]|uniref:sensor histidine kinase n=1 Tax=uncultured Intestinibacter sp. TaxID=1505659 RepID=UPI0027DBDDB6|nr:PAS domain-containing sensor histidine kinase [uncultured Intestinibacter sp.]MDU1201670.1 PAS domain-containing sensor histidine kinase [Clostridiales bacterium]
MKFLNRKSYLIDFVGVYLLIIGGVFTVLKDMNIYYMYLILIIINGIIGMFAYIMSIVTLSTSEDGIYKDLARIFGIVSITNALFAIYVFDNLNYDTLNKEIEITLVNLGVQASLYILFVYIYSKKNKIYKFNNIANVIAIFIPILYILITWTSIIPDISDYVKNIFCSIFLIKYIYCILKIDKLNKQFYNYNTIRDIKILFICRIIILLFMIFLGAVEFTNIYPQTSFGNKLNCIGLIFLNFIHVYLVYTICFRDIIKRPNRNLYYNLLDEREKLKQNIEKIEEVNFNMEYYKIIYEQLLKNMPSGIIISHKHKIMFVNNKVLKLFKLDSEENIINKNISDLIYKEDREKYDKTIKSIDKNEKKESVIHTRFSYNNVMFEAQEIRFYETVHQKTFQVSIIDSIEDKIKLEDAKRELQLRDVMEKTRDEVLSNISHEFKTPVNVIYSTVQIQDLNLQKEDYDKILEFNKLIKQNCNRLIRLINNFIDSTKLENNKVEIHKKRVNIVSITEDITMSVINFAKRQKIDVVFDAEQEELYCDIDIDQMERIMLNILSNAIKYNKPNGNIDVIVKDRKEKVYIDVIDSGIGIPKDRINTIFDRFERMENKNAVIKEGSGIGLSIVKKLVDALDGEINIESEVDKGTTVRLIFKKSKNQNGIEEVYDISQHLEEKVNLEMSDIS